MSEETTLRKRWTGEVPLYVAAVAWAAVCLYLTRSAGLKFPVSGVVANSYLVVAAVLAYGGMFLVGSLARYRPDSPISYLRQRHGNRAWLVWIIGGLPIVAISVGLLPLFSNMKGMIPYFTDYTWDQTFIDWDRALFFGQDPWRLLWPIFGNSYVTALIGVFYHLWILLLYLGCVFMLFDPRIGHELRRQFFLSYILCWALLGSVLATLLASVGPVFAEPILGIDTFVPQMELLEKGSETAYLMTLQVQDGLLLAFQQQARGLGAGITAMPSLHVAIACLFWLAMRQLDRRAGHFFLTFLAVIWVGSVHTAYHYAVDGLISIIGVFVIWKFSGWVIAKWDALLAKSGQPTLRTNTVPAE
ncbi:phosphatase PAP2 family protein [Altererythrobacter sp. MF3-039]|uniref:phosphatase PAP2 family protein n=1 Tax=Altererythrobacter sp. MF3-039 TaxID=3252901 RepID=UPI00390C498B